MAMNAFEGLVKRNSSKMENWKYIHVCSESFLNGSKPIASQLLSLTPYRNIIVEDRLSACISGLNSLLEGPGLVVTSDIAKYGVDEEESLSADFTGGAGAVAVEIGKGDLLEMDENYGVYSSDQYDFHKPYQIEGDSLKGSMSPVVDGPLSRVCYLYHIGEAYKDLKSKTGYSLSDLDGVVFHVPYPGITKYALSYLDLIDSGKAETVAKKLSDLIDMFEFRNEENYHEIFKKNEDEVKSILKSNLNGRCDIISKLEPSLRLPAETGNIYTGSVFLSLCSSLLYSNYSEDSRIGVFGYGSGSSSLALVMKTTPKTKEIVGEWNIEFQLKNRSGINFEEYQGFRQIGVASGWEENDYLKDGEYFLKDIDSRGVRIYGKCCHVESK